MLLQFMLSSIRTLSVRRELWRWCVAFVKFDRKISICYQAAAVLRRKEFRLYQPNLIHHKILHGVYSRLRATRSISLNKLNCIRENLKANQYPASVQLLGAGGGLESAGGEVYAWT